MRRSIILATIIFITLILGYALGPVIDAHLPELRRYLLEFRSYSHANPVMGYFVFMAMLGATILTGLPLATVWMISAGLLFSFWEAAVLIMLGRLIAADIAFMLARRVLEEPRPPRYMRYKRTATLWERMEQHPNIGLLIARLAPIPDGVVNYTSAAAHIRHTDYLLVSLLGMLPITLICVWMGQQLGSISSLIRWLQ